MTDHRIGLVRALLFGGSALVMLGACTLASRALGHSWYSLECCSGHDCGPVDETTVTEGPEGYAVQLKTAKALIPYGDSRIKISADRDFHVCEPYPGHVRCLYVPGRAF